LRATKLEKNNLKITNRLTFTVCKIAVWQKYY